MQRLLYLLAYPLLWLLAHLPFPILYVISDGVFFLIFYVVRYRRKVVQQNLALVFPDKPAAERRQIERAFYAHMCDMFLEMIKTMGMSEQAIKERFIFRNLEILKEFEGRGQSVMLLMPHYASWEWAISLNYKLKARGYGIYQPLNNEHFDKLVRRIRGKFGATLITTRETREIIAKNKAEGRLATYGIIIDQSPQLKKAYYWGSFMGIEVPMHVGAEVLCKAMDLPVVYLKVTKLKRGHYQGEIILLTDSPSSVPDYGITDAFFRETERAIREAPQYYFWTHKRWKHRNKKPAAPLSPKNSR